MMYRFVLNELLGERSEAERSAIPIDCQIDVCVVEGREAVSRELIDPHRVAP